NELKARVEAMVRRYIDFNQKSTDQSDILTIDGMQIDKENRTVKISDNNIELTNKEFDLLYFLASNKGRIFTKKQIYTNVWEEDYLFDDSNIMSFISKLRKKIEPNPEEPTYILTVRGVGYRFSKGV
ncbi:MAG: response regulator transcription factor, partial [Peptoniphilus sp.]